MTYTGSVLVEACVDTVASVAGALAGGAGRLELCDNLVEGGTTPSPGMLAVARERSPVPIHTMIRPRGGDFLYAGDEVAVMLADIAAAERLRADGVVIGALTADGRVDRELVARLIDAARPMTVVFHRAFDLTRDPVEALETLIDLEVDRVLSSGQAPTAEEGIPVLKEMVRRAEGRIVILAGGGITEANAARIVRETGVREIHLRGSKAEPSPVQFRRENVKFGKSYEPDEYRRVETDPVRIRAVVNAVGP
jgi:copper homeostasis protein